MGRENSFSVAFTPDCTIFARSARCTHAQERDEIVKIAERTEVRGRKFILFPSGHRKGMLQVAAVEHDTDLLRLYLDLEFLLKSL